MLEKDHMKVLEVFDVGELVNLNCGTRTETWLNLRTKKIMINMVLIDASNS